VSLVCAVVLAVAAEAVAKPPFRKPPPPGVLEIIGTPYGPIIEMQDGSIMMANGSSYRVSTDGGQTWNKDVPISCNGLKSVRGLTRLPSGDLVMTYEGGKGFCVAVSKDQGQTWSEGQPVKSFGSTREDSLIALSSGRLLYPSRKCFSNDDHPSLQYEDVSTFGSWRGARVQLAGHYHYPEIDIAAVSRSDDLGKTWEQSGYLYGWFDWDGVPNGKGGVTACDEPQVVECEDGRVLFMARSTVGRLVYSYSEDGGEKWTAVRPTELAACYSPCRVVRLPDTGDLLLVWNQVNSSEIQRGYRRGRLSAAISTDSGHSWKNFRTIEVSAGLEDVDRVPVDPEIKPVVGLPWVGPIPDGYARFFYPFVDIAGGKVFVRYGRGWFERIDGETVGPTELKHEAKGASERVLRIYPLEYFYE
jgi:hypothetical protein